MAKNGTYKIAVERRVATLEANHEELKRSISEIKNNHLEHLAADVKSLQTQIQDVKLTIAKWGGGMAVIIVLAELFINKFLK